MTDAAMSGLKSPRKITGRDVLLAFIVFFGVVFAVNGYFLHFALSTYTGVVSAEPYRKGLHYNQRIAAETRQDALGWKDEIHLAGDGRLSVAIKGIDGKPIERLIVAAVISRPSTARFDRLVALQERAPGVYTAATQAIDPGSWIVALEARSKSTDTEPTYRARRRLWLNP
jgi:nitrogen fixation protein FixH